MKKSIITTAILALALVYQACYEDKGDYNYAPTNAVTIDMRAYTINAYLGDTLRYTPTITFADPSDTTGFEYWWENKGAMGLLGRHEIINQGRELRFGNPIIGSQNVQICVRETRTGVITTAQISVNGVSRYAKGWLVLREESGESKLAFILPERSTPGDLTSARVYVPIPDLYAQLFPGVTLGRGPVAIRQGFSQRGDGAILYVLQDDETVCLNGVSYARAINLAQEFVGGAPAYLAPRDYYQGHYANIVLNADNTAYFRTVYYGSNTDLFTYSFANFPMEYQGELLKIDRVIPSIAERAYFFAIHDRENARVLFLYAGNAILAGSALPTFVDNYPAGEHLEYHDLDDADLLHAAFYNEQLGMMCSAESIVLYRRGGKTYVQRALVAGEQMSMSTGGLNISAVTNAEFSGQAYLAANTKYYQLKTRQYLFFATGNQLYWYEFSTGVTRPFHAFPAGSEVVDISSNPQESELGVILSTGKFITLDIVNERLMGTDNQLYEVNIPGRLVDLEYKFPSLGGYSNRASQSNWD
jgi:hypothetical protein